ncbi:Proteasome subunit beta type-3 [Castilleja foliolosa]|uniref:Proteasome subunit beta type-3 n=1 Tax=Castilleja foliolosa TaxID=1961234 RepID=A0ABD3EBJ9_9LAMI
MNTIYDALEQEQSSGSFTPSGRNDILAVAIGKPDHPTRVRGVGKGYTVRTYFGKQQRPVDGMVSREEVAAIVADLKASMQAEMQANLRAEMKMILSSQATSAAEPLTPVGMSAKGSCAPDVMASDQQDEQGVNDVSDGDCELYAEDPHKQLVAYGKQLVIVSCAPDVMASDQQDEQGVNDVSDGDCELYAEDPHKQLVAYGRIHLLGSNIHHRKMNDDETRLVVDNVKQGDSQRELFPKKSSRVNDEPQITPVNKVDALKTLWIAAADIKDPRNVCIEAGIVGLTRTSAYINHVDIMGLLATGTISASTMKFYNKCLYNILKSTGRADRYGLMCPLTIQTQGNNEDMGLIRNRIGEGGWDLLAFCPKVGCITWFSCTGKGKKMKKKFPEMIETAFEAYHVVKGLRSNTLSKPKWVYPKCCQQDVGDPECGLFVMRHMLEIIKLDIANSFEKGLCT